MVRERKVKEFKENELVIFSTPSRQYLCKVSNVRTQKRYGTEEIHYYTFTVTQLLTHKFEPIKLSPFVRTGHSYNSKHLEDYIEEHSKKLDTLTKYFKDYYKALNEK